MHLLARSPLLPLAALLLAACGPVDADRARQGWLVEQLYRDNRVWLSRDPQLLAWKYQAMAAAPYDFVRGSAGVWFADQARSGADRVPTRFALGPTTAQLLLVGDPHPENFGTMLPGPGPGPDQPGDPDADELRIELNDLDAAAFGPWGLDLRRAALGLSVLAGSLDGCDDTCIDEAVGALAGGYADAATGARDLAPGDDAALGAVLSDRLEDARSEGPARKKLDSYTTIDENGQRRLLRDAAPAADGTGMVAPTTQEQDQLARLAGQLVAAGPADFRLLDAVRRYGSGVASLPVVRYVLLWDRGQQGPEDDDLLNLREVVDPPTLPGLGGSVPGLFDSQADRAGRAPALVWSVADADALMTGLTDGEQTFKATSWSSWFQRVDRVKLAGRWDEGSLGPADLAALGAAMGGLLAQAHGRAPTASGTAAGPALAAELKQRRTELVEETVAAAQADRSRALADHALFVDALQSYGPLLGAELPTEGVAP